MDANKIVLTGIKPTGTAHLGNMIGAIMPIINMAKNHSLSYVFIADLHALNAIRDSKIIKENTYNIVATFLALGLDPKKTILFRQSDIQEIYALATLLNNVTPKGLMNRSHAYKAMVEKNLAKNDDADAGINMGLFTYPILMSADILLYNADLVPVGQDQKQHVEFARDIADNLNHIYNKQILNLPLPVISQAIDTIPGLDGRKMSKSYNNIIPIFAAPDQLKSLIMRIITDSKSPQEAKDPDSSAIFQLYRHFASPSDIEIMKARFLEGNIGYREAKELLYNAISQYMQVPNQKYHDLLLQPEQIEGILIAGALSARIVAKQTLDKVLMTMLGHKFFT